jgi:hypothetical protein
MIRIMKSRIGLEGHVERVGEKRDEYMLLLEKPEGKKSLGTDIKMAN